MEPTRILSKAERRRIDVLLGSSIQPVLKGSEVIGYSLGGTTNDLQIKLTDGRVIRMHGYFTDEGYT